LDGGLGLCPDDGEMVAILSENSMVKYHRVQS
jgi:hypothetical protein